MFHLSLLRSWTVISSTALAVILCIATPGVLHAAQRSAANYIEPGSIVIDGRFSDWPDGSLVIDESDEHDVEKTLYCWDTDAQQWEEVASQSNCVDSYLFDEFGQIDLKKVYFGLNTTDMFVGFETAFPLYGVVNTATNEYTHMGRLHTELDIPVLPHDFDHSFVLSFGPKKGADFAYYLVVRIVENADLSLDETEDERDGMFIYKESGQTPGFQIDEDLLMEEMEDIDSDSTIDDHEGERTPSRHFEVRQNIERFLEITGLSYESYSFHMETHSTGGDVTERVLVNFGLSQRPSKIHHNRVSVPNKSNISARVNWPDSPNALSYKVQLKKWDDKNNRWKYLNTFATEESELWLRNKWLNPATKYMVKVKACNDTGCSGWGSGRHFQMKNKPEKIHANRIGAWSIETGSAMQLNWPTLPKVVSYKVQVKRWDGKRWVYEDTYKTRQSDFRFANGQLASGTRYAVKVKACSKVSCGMWGSAREFFTR